MTCDQCPYSLVCLAGKLDEDPYLRGLCPQCKRLFIATWTHTTEFEQCHIALFYCEQRPWGTNDQTRWERLYGRRPTATPAYTQVALQPDGVSLRYCPECTDWITCITTIEDLDTKRTEEDRRQRNTPAFQVAPRRRK